MDKEKKYFINFALERAEMAAVGSYALATGETWSKAFLTPDDVKIPDWGMLVLASVILVMIWAILGYIRSKLQD